MLLGRCPCGGVRLAIGPPPGAVIRCHCSMCAIGSERERPA
jgi:hypothetical protein